MTDLLERASLSTLERRRRWRSVVVGGCLATVLLLTGLVYAATYTPRLRVGSWGFQPKCVSVGEPVHLDDGETVSAGRQSCSKIGDEITWAFTLRNDGPSGVTIYRIGDEGYGTGPGASRMSPISPIEVRTYSSAEMIVSKLHPHAPDPIHHFDGLRAFAPFSLGPGDERIIAFRATVVDACTTEGGGGIFGSLPIHYSFFGFRHTVLFFPPLQLTIGCPLQPPG